MLLLVIRVYFALSPSYLHPDENFQGPEVFAGMSSCPVHAQFLRFNATHFSIALSITRCAPRNPRTRYAAPALPYTRRKTLTRSPQIRSHILIPVETTMGVHSGTPYSQHLPIMGDLRAADEPVEMVLYRDRVRQPTTTTGLLCTARRNVPIELCAGRLGDL